MKKCFKLLLLASCFLRCFTPQPSQISNKQLRYGIPQAPLSLDPAATSDLSYYQIAFNIFETLIATDWEKGVFVPKLATSWQPDSTGMQWTFSLRQGVVFHDGSDLNADAVKCSFERQFDLNSPFYRRDQTDIYSHFALSMIKEIRAINDSTVQFILKYPYSAFLDNLATPYFAAIVSPRALKEFGDTFGQHPVGTGPFQFESWAPDSQIVIKKFQRYWGEPPQIDNVIYKITPSHDAKLQQIRNGELEIISGMSASSIDELYHSPGVKVVERELLITTFLGFNCQIYPFSEIKVRRAIGYALDKKNLVFTISRGLATVAKGPLPPMTADYDSTLISETYDHQTAQALLQSAGCAPGTKVNLHFLVETDTLRATPYVQAFKAYLEQAGLQVEIVPHLNEQTYSKAILSGNVGQLFWQGSKSYTRHSDSFLYPLFHSQSPHNLFQYKNPEVDSLLEQARRTPDAPTQRALYRKIQEIILQDVPAVFLGHPKAVYAIRNRVKNFRVDPLAIPWLNEVELESEE